MNIPEVADAIDDLVHVLDNATHEEVIGALVDSSLLSEEEAGELKELIG